MKEVEIKKLMLAEMINLREKGPTAPDFGICYHLDNVLLNAENAPCSNEDDDEAKIEAILKHMFPKWPKYSGNMDYPVPAPDGSNPYKIFYKEKGEESTRTGRNNRNNWVDEYGALRYELLDFLISELQKEFA